MSPSKVDKDPLGQSRISKCSSPAPLDSSLTVIAVDLPILQNKPSYEKLLKTLKDLELLPTTWNGASTQNPFIEDKSISQYLLSIISSDLNWLEKDDDESELVDDQKDELWELASRRLAERCGRSGKFVH